jgi:1-acyl-sn-glycerol-3-phosphate acyltransferase
MYEFFRVVLRILFSLLFRLRAEGLHNIPKDGPVIMCCNHISNIDPPLLGSPFERKIYYMAKEELFKIPVLGWIIPRIGAFPVKRGGVSKESIRNALNLLSEGKMIGVFPEGTRNSKVPAKKGAAVLALRSEAVIVPAAIIGNYSLFNPMIIRYGEPIKMDEFRSQSDGDSSEQVTAEIMKAINRLKQE